MENIQIKMARDLTSNEKYTDDEINCIIVNEGVLDYGSSEDINPRHTENIVKILKKYIPTITKEQYENDNNLQDLQHYNQTRILRKVILNLAYTIKRDRRALSEIKVDLEYELKDSMNKFLKDLSELSNYNEEEDE